MPGLVVLGRRWAVGSDDLVVPGAILFTLHFLWCIALGVILGLYTPKDTPACAPLLLKLLCGHMAIIVASAINELVMCAISMRGSILDAAPRASIQKLIYARIAILILDILWLSLSIAWLKHYYVECPTPVAKEALLGLVVSGFCVVGSVVGTCWCTWDAAGRSWVKLKRYQRAESRLNQRRSGSRNRNWRQRKVLRAYQDSWDHRCRILFCCMRPSDRNRSSFTDIARLLSDFFRELDVVPSDVVAGLVLLRQFQKIEQQAIVKQRKNDVYEFLSGVPVTSKTQFLALNDPAELEMFQTVVHYMHYALGAYGWPMFLMTSTASSACGFCASLRCCCGGTVGGATVVHDNCCQCNYTALRHLLKVGDVDITYATYHVDVAETPFFIAVDHEKRTVVLSIRGTLSMKDVMTDLNAEGEPLPLTPPIEDWFGHKGMVHAAEYIYNKLQREQLLENAFKSNRDRSTDEYRLVLVGHSLGAGTAAILAILLRPRYPDLLCYSYSPPGGLLSMPAVQYSKEFTTSVVLGKDVVPRIGLHQLEALRADLINAIQRSVDPKWKTIVCSAVCCCNRQPRSAVALSASGATGLAKYQQAKDVARSGVVHPESGGTLTLHRPLLPPGRILHLVRHHPGHSQRQYESHWSKMVKKREPVYQAVWAENTDFDEVLISPGMIQDHMPDKVLEALNKIQEISVNLDQDDQLEINGNASDLPNLLVVTQTGPRKPQRTSVSHSHLTADPLNLPGLTPPHRLCLETSFTSLQSPTVQFVNADSSKTSSITGSIYNSSSTTTKVTTKIQSPNQFNSILSYDFASLLDDQFNTASASRTLTPSITSDRFSNQPLGVYNFSSATNGIPYRGKKPPGNDSSKITMAVVEPSKRSSVEPKASYLRENDTCKVDLIHDDWFGLAPLASPESLSELSSISSRTSLCQVNDRIGTSIITVASVSRDGITQPLVENDTLLSNDYAMSTPKVLRRTPKIPGNLSTCADDIKNVVKYQKMNQNFRFLGRRIDGSLSNSSRESSFESATSAESGQLATVRTAMPVIRSPLKYIPSLDRSDGSLKLRKPDSMQTDLYNINVKEGYYSAENIIETKSVEQNFVTKSDSNILEVIVIEPNENTARDLKKYENGSAIVHKIEEKSETNPQISTSSEIFVSTKSSMHSYESFDTQSTLGERKSLLMKEKCLYGSSISSEGSPMHRNASKGEGARLLEDSETDKERIEAEDDERGKKISMHKKRCKSIGERNIFSQRNESLPLLSNIGSSITHSPPASYVKRKKYVYPTSSVFSKGESSV